MDTANTPIQKLLDEDNPEAKGLADMVHDLKEAAEAMFGAKCDVAIAIVPHSNDTNQQRALAITPEGTPIEVAAKTMWLSLGALQLAMHEAGMMSEAMGDPPTPTRN